MSGIAAMKKSLTRHVPGTLFLNKTPTRGIPANALTEKIYN